MRYLRYLSIPFLLLLALPAYAVQITVPSAPSNGYTLTGLSTGNYQATTTIFLTPDKRVLFGSQANPASAWYNFAVTTASSSDAILGVHAPSAFPWIYKLFNDAFSATSPVQQAFGFTVAGNGLNSGVTAGDILTSFNSRGIFTVNSSNAGNSISVSNVSGANSIGLGIGTTSPSQAYLTVATPMLATGVVPNLFLISSSTSGTATSTIFQVNNSGNVSINPGNVAGFGTLTVNAASTVFTVNGSGVTVNRGGTSNAAQLSITGSANVSGYTASSIGSGLSVTTPVATGGGSGKFFTALINPTNTQQSGGHQWLLGAYEGVTASTSNGLYVTTGDLGNNTGVGSTSPYAKFGIHLNNSDTGFGTTAFAIGSSTATATSTLFSINNVGSTTLGNFGACSGTSALTTDANGTIVCGAITSSGSSFGYPWTTLTNFGTTTAATTTPLWAQGGIFASSTSVIASTTFLSTSAYVGVASSTPYSLFTIDTTGNIGQTGAAFSVASSTRTDFTVLQNGNVGIGTTTPTGALTIVDRSTTGAVSDTVLGVHARSNTPYLFGMFNDASSKTVPGLLGFEFSSNGQGNQQGFVSGDMLLGNAGNHALSLFTNAYTNPRFTIGASGNIAIGSTSPVTTEALFSISPLPGVGNINNFFLIASSTGGTATTTLLSTTRGGQTSACETVYGNTANGAFYASSTAITIDFQQSCNQVLLQIGFSATTVTITNAKVGDTKRIIVTNPGGTAGALTWSGVVWLGGTTPTQTTTSNSGDIYSCFVTQATSTTSVANKVECAQSTSLQ